MEDRGTHNKPVNNNNSKGPRGLPLRPHLLARLELRVHKLNSLSEEAKLPQAHLLQLVLLELRTHRHNRLSALDNLHRHHQRPPVRLELRTHRHNRLSARTKRLIPHKPLIH